MKFENYSGKNKYWIVPTKLSRSALLFGLKNIGLSDDKSNNDINMWCNVIEGLSKECDFIYLFFDYDDDNWTYSRYYGSRHQNEYCKRSNFMGKLKVTEIEIDAEKYNL